MVESNPAAEQSSNQGDIVPYEAKPEEDLERFTGLRIANRTVPAEKLREGLRGKCVVPFREVPVKCIPRYARQQNRDHVIIGVLYHGSDKEKHQNGEHFIRWCLTDLAEPRSRQIILHLRFEAYAKWKGAPAATRGSIFAVLNPSLVEGGEGPRSDPVLRIETKNQLTKLGESPSLGICEMKGCTQPCNLEEKQRHCGKCLSLVWSDKKIRTAAGGGADIYTSAILRSEEKKASKKNARNLRAAALAVATEDWEDEVEAAERERRLEAGKRARTNAAMQLDNRRFNSSQAKESYVKSLLRGEKPESLETSMTPVLGRGLNDDSCLELDISTLDTDERLKAERMLEQPAPKPKLTEKQDAKSGTKRPSAASSPGSAKKPAVEKQSLGDLIKAASARRMARRGDNASEAGKRSQSAAVASIAARAQETFDTGLPEAHDANFAPSFEADAEASSAATAQMAPGEQRIAAAESSLTANDESASTLREAELSTQQPQAPAGELAQFDVTAPLEKDLAAELAAELALAGQDCNKIKKVLQAAAGLGENELETMSAHKLYEDIGRIIQSIGREDVKQLALGLRRKFRLATFKPATVSAEGGA